MSASLTRRQPAASRPSARPVHQHRLVPQACALAAALLLAPGAWAAATVTGSVTTSGGGTFIGGSAGDFLLSGQSLNVGQALGGGLVLDGGSLLQATALEVAQNAGGTTPAQGSSFIDLVGANTRMVLDGVNNRLMVGAWGVGSMQVLDGASLDARSVACNGFCGAAYVGGSAGSDGRLSVAGAGSSVSLRAGLFVGNLAVFNPPSSAFTLGTPGGVARGAVEVLDGATLLTSSATLATGPNGTAPTGSERSFASAVVDGPGALWRLAPEGSGAVSMNLAAHANASATLAVAGGGVLRIEGLATQNNALVIGQAGRADASISGAGSRVEFVGNNNGVLHVGRSAGAQGTLSLTNGGVLSGVWYTGVGRDGATGTLTVDGVGSLYRADGNNTVAAAGGQFVASIDMGRNGGIGTMNVRNGGRVEIVSTLFRSGGGVGLSLGRDAGSTGTLNIGGAGSVVQLQAGSVLPGGGAGEAFNPTVTVGRLGTGVLNITGGGKLLVDGNAVSTVAASRTTAVRIGGTGDSNSGGTGVALVSGLNSELAVRGSDAFLAVGLGAGATGQLTVADQAVVRSTVMAVGRSGGVGTVQLNGGQVLLSGQHTGNNLAGASLSLGTGGGTGVMTMANNALLRVDNSSGNVSSGVTIGGSGNFPGGQGVLTMTSGARIEVAGPAGMGGLTVGRDGAGVLSMSGSSIDVGATGAVVLGRSVGSSGTLTMTDGSTLSAQYVGVGRFLGANGVSVNGGAGTLIINSGSVLSAQTIEIGSAGYLGGIGTLSGNVINYGTFNPGNSPGTMVIDGSYTAGLGGKLVLEVGLDSAGQFITDQVIFTPGSQVNLDNMVVEFKFLGAADPTQFSAQTGRFDVDTFLKQQVSDGQGGVTLQALDDAVFSEVTFTAVADSFAISNFNYNASTDALSFAAAPVPEPGTWALLAAGLLSLGWLRRRQAGR